MVEIDVGDGEEFTAETEQIVVHVAICTFNRAETLDLTLQSLASQDAPPNGSWAVLVVDNNCTDHTRAVVDRHIAAGRIPSLTVVSETVQGLVPARQRSFLATDAHGWRLSTMTVSSNLIGFATHSISSPATLTRRVSTAETK